MNKAKKSSTDEQLFAEAVRASAQQIWQAGLGAFGKAQEESSKMFASLIRESADAQARHLKSGKSAPADQSVDKAEQGFEADIKKQMQVLSDRLDAMQLALAALTDKSALTVTKKRPAKPSSSASTTAAATVSASKKIAATSINKSSKTPLLKKSPAPKKTSP
jgi:Poly(hydroxyalcanoate) granule associated protein (phasin)